MNIIYLNCELRDEELNVKEITADHRSFIHSLFDLHPSRVIKN